MSRLARLRAIPHSRYVAILGTLFAVVFVLSGFHAHHPLDWALENALVVPAVAVVLALHRRLIFSRVSYTLIFVFLSLHELGAHYTYSEVPYDEWFRALSGYTLSDLCGWQRNHFDRLVHFCYGLLLAYPVREIFMRVADVRGFWCYFLPLDLTMSTSMLYELIEWLAVGVFGGDLGVAYLGTQGDPFDAQKDMALAAVGALLTMLVTALVNVRSQRDFAREWNESLRVKHPAPLEEDELDRMQRRRRKL